MVTKALIALGVVAAASAAYALFTDATWLGSVVYCSVVFGVLLANVLIVVALMPGVRDKSWWRGWRQLVFFAALLPAIAAIDLARPLLSL